MKNSRPRHLCLFALGAFGAVALATSGGCSKAIAQEAVTSVAPKLDLTVYKDDFALVHDTRSITLASGQDQVQLPGVSKQLDPNSVMFDWPSGGKHPEVVSTTYNVGVDSSQALMKRLVGQDVDVVWRGQDGKESDRVSGRLEEAGQGTVLHTKSGYLIDPGGEVVVPGNRSFPTMPELVAKVQSQGSSATKLGVSYLTRGLSWSADYVGVLAEDGKTMKLECWGTVSNQTGTDFPAAKLKLVAGNPNRAVVEPSLSLLANSDMQPKAFGGFGTSLNGTVRNAAPVPTGELYSYNIQSNADISQGQMNRVRIFHGASVPIVTTYSIGLEPWMEGTQRHSAQVAISFTNNEVSGLGLPLPGGALRAYDAAGETESYVGAATVGDTPKGERVSLTLSDVFDVYAKSRQTGFKKVAKHLVAASFETLVYNEKKTAIDVRLSQSFGSPIKVLNESSPSKSPSYGVREWTVHVPSGGHTTLDYTIQMRS